MALKHLMLSLVICISRAVYILWGVAITTIAIISAVYYPFAAAVVLGIFVGGFAFILIPYFLVRHVQAGAPVIVTIRMLLIAILILSGTLFSLFMIAFHIMIFFFSADSPELPQQSREALLSIGHGIEARVHPVGAVMILFIIGLLSGMILLLRDSKTGRRYFELPSDVQSDIQGPILEEKVTSIFSDERQVVQRVGALCFFMAFAPMIGLLLWSLAQELLAGFVSGKMIAGIGTMILVIGQIAIIWRRAKERAGLKK